MSQGGPDVRGLALDLVAPDSIEISTGASPPGLWRMTRSLSRSGATVHRMAVVLKSSVPGVPDGHSWLPLTISDESAWDRVRIENVSVLDGQGSVAYAAGSALPSIVEGRNLPTHTELLPNFPNPFNPNTAIPFALAAPSEVRVIVFSPLGQRVRTLVRAELPAGYHTVSWDGRDDLGRPAASGIYLYRLEADRFTAVRKALLVK